MFRRLPFPSPFVLWLIAGACLPLPVRAAWTEPAGQGIVINTLTLTTARASFDGEGAAYVTPKRRRVENSLYLQYGLREGWTLIAQPTYAWNRTSAEPVVTWDEGEGPGQRQSGLSKVFLASRHRLWQGSADVFSVQPGITFSPGERDRAVLLGGGDVIGEMRLLWGRNLAIPDPLGGEEIASFLVAELAPRLPEGGQAPLELALDVTVGTHVAPGTMMLAQSFNKLPLTSHEGHYAKHQMQSTVVVDIGWGASVQVGGLYTFAGRNVAQETGGLLALWWRF